MFLLLSTTPGLSLSDTGGCHSAHQNSRYCGDCPQQYGGEVGVQLCLLRHVLLGGKTCMVLRELQGSVTNVVSPP